MEIYDIDGLKAAISGGFEPKYVFFWGHTGRGYGPIGAECLSQWYPAPFTDQGRIYPTAEHWMMVGKAELFGDDDIAHKLMQSHDPGQAKALGRQVRGFDEAVWAAHRVERVVQGNRLKFEQNIELRQFLVRTGSKVLVEASPNDRIWGIGLAADDERARTPSQWRGENLLGFALMRVRGLLCGDEDPA